jgi:hypothetical protein
MRDWAPDFRRWKKLTDGYSPFTAKEYKIKSPYKTKPDPDKTKDVTVKE